MAESESPTTRYRLAKGWTVARPRTLKRFHIAELKSALQKYVRRDEVGKACAVAHEMMSRGKEERKSALLRLPIIAGEENGWPLITEAARISRDCEKAKANGELKVATRKVIEFAGKMATAPKSGDTLAIWGHFAGPGKDKESLSVQWPDQLMEALKSKNEEQATNLAFRAVKSKTNSNVFWELLRQTAKKRNKALADLVEASKWRLGFGIRGGDVGVFVAGAILGLCRYTGKEKKPRISKDEINFVLNSLDWYVYDFHTWVGKRAMFEYGRRTKSELPPSRLGQIQFYIESLMGKHSLAGDRWFDPVADWQIRHQVKISGGTKEAKKIWREIRPEIRTLIREELKRGRKL